MFPHITPSPRRFRSSFWLVLAALLVGTTLILTWPLLPIGGPFGYLAARKDIRQNHLAIRLPELPHAWWKTWQTRLKTEYGIEIGGRAMSCFGDLGFSGSYDRAYNATQIRAIKAKFGRDIPREELEKIPGSVKIYHPY